MQKNLKPRALLILSPLENPLWILRGTARVHQPASGSSGPSLITTCKGNVISLHAQGPVASATPPPSHFGRDWPLLGNQVPLSPQPPYQAQVEPVYTPTPTPHCPSATQRPPHCPCLPSPKPANAGDLRYVGSIRVEKIPWRRAWQHTPVFLLGETQGQKSLVGYSPWGFTESDTTEAQQNNPGPRPSRALNVHPVSHSPAGLRAPPVVRGLRAGPAFPPPANSHSGNGWSLFWAERHVTPPWARTSPLPKNRNPSVLSQWHFSSALQRLSGPFKLSNSFQPPKSKSYFLFLPHSWLYIVPRTIANLGRGLNTWTGLVYCLNTRPRAVRSHSRPTGNWEGSPKTAREPVQPCGAPRVLALLLLCCAVLESWLEVSEPQFSKPSK